MFCDIIIVFRYLSNNQMNECEGILRYKFMTKSVYKIYIFLGNALKYEFILYTTIFFQKYIHACLRDNVYLSLSHTLKLFWEDKAKILGYIWLSKIVQFSWKSFQKRNGVFIFSFQ